MINCALSDSYAGTNNIVIVNCAINIDNRGRDKSNTGYDVGLKISCSIKPRVLSQQVAYRWPLIHFWSQR